MPPKKRQLSLAELGFMGGSSQSQSSSGSAGDGAQSQSQSPEDAESSSDSVLAPDTPIPVRSDPRRKGRKRILEDSSGDADVDASEDRDESQELDLSSRGVDDGGWISVAAGSERRAEIEQRVRAAAKRPVARPKKSAARPKRAAPNRSKRQRWGSSESGDSEDSFIDDDDDDDFAVPETSRGHARPRPKRVTRSRKLGRRSDDDDDSMESEKSSVEYSDSRSTDVSSGSSDDSSYFSVDSDEGTPAKKRRKTDISGDGGVETSAVKVSPPAAHAAPAVQDGMSEYERKRAANIAANAAMLARLGMGDLGKSLGQQLGVQPKAAIKPKTTPKPRTKPKHAAPIQTRRYGLRRRASDGTAVASSNNAVSGSSSESEDFVPPTPETFDDSGVVLYSVGEGLDLLASAAYSESATELSFAPVSGIAEVSSDDGDDDDESSLSESFAELSFMDPALKKIYTMDFSLGGTLLCAAGSDGRVSVFPLKDATMPTGEGQLLPDRIRTIDPVLSFRDGRGWVSSVQFVEHEQADSSPDQAGHGHPRRPLWVAVSGNDGNLHLWDCSRRGTSSGSPPLLATCATAHTSGIFSMDYNKLARKFVTGGKDKGVAVLDLRDEGEFNVAHRIADAHAGVVKSTAWRPEDANHFLSSGNDAVVRFWDDRAPTVPQEFDGGSSGHRMTINSVSWHPSDENSFISCGAEPFILVWDVRHSRTPVCKLDQHVNPGTDRVYGIWVPAFVSLSGHTYVVTGGEKTKAVHTYCIEDNNQPQHQQQEASTPDQHSPKTARVMSRGNLGKDVSNLLWDRDSKTLAVAKQGSVSLLRPVYQRRQDNVTESSGQA